MLEPCAGKLARTVLRGRCGGNVASLLGENGSLTDTDARGLSNDNLGSAKNNTPEMQWALMNNVGSIKDPFYGPTRPGGQIGYVPVNGQLRPVYDSGSPSFQIIGVYRGETIGGTPDMDIDAIWNPDWKIWQKNPGAMAPKEKLITYIGGGLLFGGAADAVMNGLGVWAQGFGGGVQTVPAFGWGSGDNFSDRIGVPLAPPPR